MEKASRNFKGVCYALLFLIGVSVLYLPVSFVTEALLLPDRDSEILLALFGIFIVAVMMIIPLLLALRGLDNVKKHSFEWWYLILNIIPLFMSFGFLDGAIENFGIRREYLFENIFHLMLVIAWIAVLLAYVWFALKFRKSCLKK